MIRSALCCRPQASMTKGSLTDRQTIRSIPRERISSALTTKPGRWAAEHVGVNAPGSANSTTLLPEKMESVEIFSGPLAPIMNKLTVGILSPTAMVMMRSPNSFE